MIIRVFRATPRPEHAPAYEGMIRGDSTTLVESQKGLVALHVGRAMDGSGELVMVSVWQDLESLQAFTGPDWQTPVALPGEQDLVERTTVANYESWV
jgi:heme-degrading monooxygenase HmoA